MQVYYGPAVVDESINHVDVCIQRGGFSFPVRQLHTYFRKYKPITIVYCIKSSSHRNSSAAEPKSLSPIKMRPISNATSFEGCRGKYSSWTSLTSRLHVTHARTHHRTRVSLNLAHQREGRAARHAPTESSGGAPTDTPARTRRDQNETTHASDRQQRNHAPNGVYVICNLPQKTTATTAVMLLI